MSDRFKRIYLFIMVVVPFVAYCGYYYWEMIRKAPFRFEDFRTIKVDYQAPDGRNTHLDVGAGAVAYALPQQGTMRDTVPFSREELQEFHRNLYTNNFFEMPHEMQNEGSADPMTGVYTIEAVYAAKQYKVTYETNYRGDRRYKDKVERIISYIESNFKKKLGGN